MITAITPTGGRPQALALLDHYMTRQTCQDFRWVVLDDCDPQTSPPNRADKIIRPAWRWNYNNTQHRSMLELLKEPGPVVVVEDDDWIHPDWIRVTKDRLETHDLVGERRTYYYHVYSRTWRRMKNRAHSSLCATACRDRAKDELIQVCREGHRMIDHALWRKHPGKLYDTAYVVGIKGLQGRPGIGVGHRMIGEPDKDMAKLRDLIGDDYRHYEGEYRP